MSATPEQTTEIKASEPSIYAFPPSKVKSSLGENHLNKDVFTELNKIKAQFVISAATTTAVEVLRTVDFDTVMNTLTPELKTRMLEAETVITQRKNKDKVSITLPEKNTFGYWKKLFSTMKLRSNKDATEYLAKVMQFACEEISRHSISNAHSHHSKNLLIEHFYENVQNSSFWPLVSFVPFVSSMPTDLLEVLKTMEQSVQFSGQCKKVLEKTRKDKAGELVIKIKGEFRDLVDCIIESLFNSLSRQVQTLVNVLHSQKTVDIRMIKAVIHLLYLDDPAHLAKLESFCDDTFPLKSIFHADAVLFTIPPQEEKAPKKERKPKAVETPQSEEAAPVTVVAKKGGRKPKTPVVVETPAAAVVETPVVKKAGRKAKVAVVVETPATVVETPVVKKAGRKAKTPASVAV